MERMRDEEEEDQKGLGVGRGGLNDAGVDRARCQSSLADVQEGEQRDGGRDGLCCVTSAEVR